MMKTLLCCILKLENNYLEEWVKHYINLGIDKIVIYDNNDIDGSYVEHIEDIKYVKDKIDENIIDVIKIPNKTCAQVESYNDCYQKYCLEYDWLMFFDVDEFLMLEKHSSIKSFLSQTIFNYIDIIHINWKVFDDNGLIFVKNNDYSLVERFKRPARSYIVHREIKSILRGSRDFKFTTSPHTILNRTYRCCNAIGNTEDNKSATTNKVIFKGAWLNHYICKTAEEYCTIKLIRNGGHTPKSKNRYNLHFFFKYNIITKEKLKYLREHLYINDFVINNLDESTNFKKVSKSNRYIKKSFQK